MGEFADKVKAVTRDFPGKVDDVVRLAALKVLTGVILRSPVDTGRFRSSWRVSVEVIDLSVEPPRKRARKPAEGGDASPPALSPADSAKLAAAGGTLAKFDSRVSSVVYVSNNLPYARRLEDGWSKQNRSGILGPTFVEVLAELDRTLARLAARQSGEAT